MKRSLTKGDAKMAAQRERRMAMFAEELSRVVPVARTAAERLLRLLRSRRPSRLDRLVAAADATISAASSVRGAAFNLERDRENVL